MVNINSLERDGLRQAELCPRHTMKMKTKNNLIPDRSQPGITMTAPTVRHRDVGDKYATGVPKIKKIRGRENIAVGTWNVRTLRPAGKLEQLTHAMSRYHWKDTYFSLNYYLHVIFISTVPQSLTSCILNVIDIQLTS